MRFVDEIPKINSFRVFKETTRQGIFTGSISWKESFGIDLVAEWTARLSGTSGQITFSYQIKKPTGEEKLISTISLIGQLHSIYPDRYIFWKFICPKRTHKSCKKSTYYIYLCEDGYFACSKCAKVYCKSAGMSESLDGLVKNPDKMAELLSSPTVPMKKKLEIVALAERFLQRREKLKRRIAYLKFLEKEKKNFDQRPLSMRYHQ